MQAPLPVFCEFLFVIPRVELMYVYISHVSNSKHDCCTIYNLLIHISYLAHGLNNMQNLFTILMCWYMCIRFKQQTFLLYDLLYDL